MTFDQISLEEKGGTRLLDDVSFTIHEGEIFGIAGVSGNGQDDLCDVISGLKRPTAGRLLFRGLEITESSIRERNASGIG